MKKMFEQPELMVVRTNNDIITGSQRALEIGTESAVEAASADRFRDFDEF